MAVEWLRDNVAAFGGDPTRITLVGQSAGGVSLDYYSYAFINDPIVHGYIPQSGSAFLAPSFGDSKKSWYQVSAELGCGGKEVGEKTVACMRALDFKKVLNATASPTSGFGPTTDGKIIFDNYEERAAAGNFNKAVRTQLSFTNVFVPVPSR
jgi:cholinesterase